MTFHTINPESAYDRLLLGQAWKWTQRRKRMYCDTGGEMTLPEYLSDAERPERKDIWVDGDGECLLTIELHVADEYTIHVTAPRNTSFQFVLTALLNIRRELFERLHATCILTSCGVYGGHENKGSRAMAEACGMTATGNGWDDETQDGTPVHWREYAITREQYYGRSENNQHERLRILSEADVARAARLSSVATGA